MAKMDLARKLLTKLRHISNPTPAKSLAVQAPNGR